MLILMHVILNPFMINLFQFKNPNHLIPPPYRYFNQPYSFLPSSSLVMKRRPHSLPASHRIKRHSASRESKNGSTTTDLCFCSQCGENWEKKDKARTFFQLPCICKHVLCPTCFSSLLASKGSMHFYCCPSCIEEEEEEESNEKLTSWVVFSPQSTRNSLRQKKLHTHYNHPIPHFILFNIIIKIMSSTRQHAQQQH